MKASKLSSRSAKANDVGEIGVYLVAVGFRVRPRVARAERDLERLDGLERILHIDAEQVVARVVGHGTARTDARLRAVGGEIAAVRLHFVVVVFDAIGEGAERARADKGDERAILIVGESSEFAHASVADAILLLGLAMEGKAHAHAIQPGGDFARFGLQIREFAALIEVAPQVGADRGAVEALAKKSSSACAGRCFAPRDRTPR